MPNLELLDVLLLVLLALGALSGFRQGAVGQALGLLGAGAGAIAAVALLPDVAAAFPTLDRFLRAMLLLAFLLLALLLGQAIGSALAAAIQRRMGRGPLAAADRLAGAAVGVAQVVLVVWFLAPILAVGPSSGLAQQIDQSAVVGVVRSTLPSPAPLLGRLRAFLAPAGLPQVFEFLETPLGSPVPVPTDAQVAALGRRAAASTVEVVGEACGLQLSGTGFSIAPGYLVTNAHVVAGERGSTVVLTEAGARERATVVFYDPAMDVALLHAPGVGLQPLPLARAEPSAGTIGVALGHPGGGGLTLIPATVRGVFTATGFDIYGRSTVTRAVIELAADVQAGDSGGPFVASDGQVAGLVFARAQTAADIGYALGIGEVRADVADAIGRTRAVSTGACAP
ncbi:MAG: MarP family serine protease [Candidatus Limnocylindrales bacterium]